MQYIYCPKCVCINMYSYICIFRVSISISNYKDVVIPVHHFFIFEIVWQCLSYCREFIIIPLSFKKYYALNCQLDELHRSSTGNCPDFWLDDSSPRAHTRPIDCLTGYFVARLRRLREVRGLFWGFRIIPRFILPAWHTTAMSILCGIRIQLCE